jgi:DNA-binding NarL/FixJ family response regulator
MAVPDRPLRILIADDNARLRAALRQDLAAAGLEICAEAGTGPDTVAAALRYHPDVCLIDVEMPGEDGITAVETISRSAPGIRLILVTATPSEEGALAAARAGADGYLPKDVNPQRLPVIVRAVAGGEAAYPRRLLGCLLLEIRGVA